MYIWIERRADEITPLMPGRRNSKIPKYLGRRGVREGERERESNEEWEKF